MRTDFAQWTVRGAGLALGVGAIWLIGTLLAAAAQVLALTFIAVLLAAALQPLVDAVRTRLPVPRSAVILVVYALFFTLAAGFAILVVPAALAQAQAAVARFPAFLGGVEAWAETIRPSALGEAVSSLVAAARETLRMETPDAEAVVGVGLTLAEVIASVFAVLTLVFFWLVGHARFQRYGLAFVPLDRRVGVREAWNEVEDRLGRWLRGQLILMAAVGTACGVVYVLLGLPSPLLLALIAGLCEAIPIVGPIIGAVPALLFAATVSPEAALAVLAATVVIQLVEANVLVPVVMRNSIGLSPLIVTLALLVGGAAGGILGALVAVPIAAAVEVILARLQARKVPVVQEATAIAADAGDDDSEDDGKEDVEADVAGAVTVTASR